METKRTEDLLKKSQANLVDAKNELEFQNSEKEKRALELIIANKELIYQNEEKEKRASELIIANKELIYQNEEKEKRASELIIANKELIYQNEEKEKRALELLIANKELVFQNNEKEKRAAELFIANKELLFQTGEKEKRAAELVIAGIELDFQNKEKEKREIVNKELKALSYTAKLAYQYSLSLIEASLDPLFTISTDGKITDMNQASILITGVSRENLIGSDFFEYFTDPVKARAGYKEVFDNGSVIDFPLTIKDHKLTDVLFNGSVYKDEFGEVLGIVVVARDVTERKRIEKDLNEARLFAELATEIAQVAKLKAEKAAKIAEESVRAKQQFLSNMSHEIRTPMNAIIGFTKVVLKTDLSAKQREYLTAIKLSGDSLIVLINDILDLAKIDAGKMLFEKVAFKLANSLPAMLHLFETKIQEKNLELNFVIDSKIPEVLEGDPVRLHQIILNLVSNAVKFTNKGEITVELKLLKEDDKTATVEFLVSDTGVGIANHKLGIIFDNFQQASSQTSRLYGGTGLGLAISKQLVESQGGSIKVVSEVDVGSCFSFVLDFQKTTKPIEFEAEFELPDKELRNIKVLVVEDIALNQLLMRTLLDEFGFASDIAANGRIAIEKLEDEVYDIILMDLQMPEMNGFETTKYIREELKLNIPIIALTADVTTVDLAKCKFVGMNDYIAKPVDDRLLYSKIIGMVKTPNVVDLAKRSSATAEEQVIQRCINLDYLTHRTRSNPKLMVEMISLYLLQTPPLVEALKSSMKSKDWGSLYSAIHKMIPSFSIVGISKDYEDMAKKIQVYASTQEESGEIADMIFKIEAMCTQVYVELNEEIEKINKLN